ncbi:uncharacterized protein LOC131223393 isoform X2 [Magnolia sinica]|uniref:uncharacterized protein LOC131223393 isoform X2 n=1 Tax=Magnolia sinica TaxID=86752 RepID=UPI00265ADDF3|nr:uncharacterized protein LOC131223393 isoform X2 [Magnolia sinica]XP_058074785.1 uncharacterized protein LOC131223393 isoform X2 [Magnolia sinica]
MAAINVVKARQIFDGRGNRNVEAVKTKTSGNFKFGLLTLLRCAENPGIYFAKCYYDTSKATDELDQKILLTELEPGAVDVFLDFICYSGGPLPDELLTQRVHVSEDFVAEQLRSMLSDM